jgi:hypothetical protein
MVRFREQRGGLEESMRTVVTLKDRAELVSHLRKVLAPLPVAAKDVKVRHYCYDDRIGWSTFIVCVGDGVAGFTDARI